MTGRYDTAVSAKLADARVVGGLLVNSPNLVVEPGQSSSLETGGSLGLLHDVLRYTYVHRVFES